MQRPQVACPAQRGREELHRRRSRLLSAHHLGRCQRTGHHRQPAFDGCGDTRAQGRRHDVRRACFGCTLGSAADRTVPAPSHVPGSIAIAPVGMPISNQLPGVEAPWRGESPICAPHGRCWRDVPGAIPAGSVIVSAAGPAAPAWTSRPARRPGFPAGFLPDAFGRSWRPEACPPSQPGPGPAAGGRVRVPGSGPPMSSRNGGYWSVISPA